MRIRIDIDTKDEEQESDREFQIEMLKIQIRNEIITGFFVALIAVGLASLASLGISLAISQTYNLWVVSVQTVVGVVFVLVAFSYWVREGKKIDTQIENLKKYKAEKKET